MRSKHTHVPYDAAIAKISTTSVAAAVATDELISHPKPREDQLHLDISQSTAALLWPFLKELFVYSVSVSLYLVVVVLSGFGRHSLKMRTFPPPLWILQVPHQTSTTSNHDSMTYLSQRRVQLVAFSWRIPLTGLKV